MARKQVAVDARRYTGHAQGKSSPHPRLILQQNNMAGEVQQSAVRLSEPVDTVELLPMGAYRLRISAFPTVGTGPSARIWPDTSPTLEAADTTKEGWQVIVSHHGEKQSIKALFDGKQPRSSNDKSIPRMTFWPHAGTVQTIAIAIQIRRQFMVQGTSFRI